MSRTVVFRAEARYEFDEAALWYEERRIGLGSEFVVEIGRAIDLAREHPQRLPVVYRDIRCVTVRRFPYSVFFREEPGRLLVLAVFHGSRDPSLWRERT